MSAPTTAEVRGAMEQAAAAEQALAKSDAAATVLCAARTVLECIALPLAEHRAAAVAERDALAAEVARLREALEIACDWWGGCEHHPDDCPGVADECKAAKRVNELAAKGVAR